MGRFGMDWLKRFFWRSKDGKVAFHGRLSYKVIRANPTKWQRILDKIKGIG